jgi:hypothetical protein
MAIREDCSVKYHSGNNCPEPTRATRIGIASLSHELRCGVAPALDDLKAFFREQDGCNASRFCEYLKVAQRRGFLEGTKVTRFFCETFGLELPERLQTRCKFCGKQWKGGREYRVSKTGSIVYACHSCVFEFELGGWHRHGWKVQAA